MMNPEIETAYNYLKDLLRESNSATSASKHEAGISLMIHENGHCLIRWIKDDDQWNEFSGGVLAGGLKE